MSFPPRAGTITDYTGRPIASTVCGRGRPALVLIHGWACHRGFWRHQTEALSRAATVVTLDLAGHGASPPPPAGRRPTIEGLAQDVVALADALALHDLIIIGHSMGGPVAVEAAIAMPGRCRLVLGVDTLTDAAFYRRRTSAEIRLRTQAFAQDFAGAMARMVGTLTLAGGPDLKTWIATEMSRPDPASALAILEALLDWDIDTRWPSLPCPAETINSKSLSHGIEPVPDLAGLTVHLMDHVGHFPMLEDPPAFLALVGDILRRHA